MATRTEKKEDTATMIDAENVVETIEEKEYRFAIYDDATEKTTEVVLKESELSDDHHRAMFMDMYEYFENASFTAQQLFLLKLEMSKTATEVTETKTTKAKE